MKCEYLVKVIRTIEQVTLFIYANVIVFAVLNCTYNKWYTYLKHVLINVLQIDLTDSMLPRSFIF